MNSNNDDQLNNKDDIDEIYHIKYLKYKEKYMKLKMSL